MNEETRTHVETVRLIRFDWKGFTKTFLMVVGAFTVLHVALTFGDTTYEVKIIAEDMSLVKKEHIPPEAPSKPLQLLNKRRNMLFLES